MTFSSRPVRDRYDVVVVGGGAAGLSAAVTLGRALRSVLVVDGGRPRNAPAQGVHGFLTREGMSPQALLDAGRAEAESYGAAIVDGEALAVQRGPSAQTEQVREDLAAGRPIAQTRRVGPP